MLTQHRRPVCLSLTAYDLPLWSVVETDATLYQKDQERFHVLLTEPLIQDFPVSDNAAQSTSTSLDRPFLDRPTPLTTPRLIWLEISPYRVIMTMQGNGQYSYRHFWEQGVYGTSRFWLQTDAFGKSHQLRLKNFTRHLALMGRPFPYHLRVEYELWSSQMQLGHYVLNLEITPEAE